MSIYLDTSASAKLLVDEAESEALAAYLDEVVPSKISCRAHYSRPSYDVSRCASGSTSPR